MSRRRTSNDEEQINARDDKLKVQRAQELDDVKKIVRTPEGSRFFKRLFSEGRIFHTTFTGNSNTFFLEGQRNLALKFLADVNAAAPECIPALMKSEDEGGLSDG